MALKHWHVRATREGRPSLLLECSVWAATAEDAARCIEREEAPGVIILSVEPGRHAEPAQEVAA